MASEIPWIHPHVVSRGEVPHQEITGDIEIAIFVTRTAGHKAKALHPGQKSLPKNQRNFIGRRRKPGEYQGNIRGILTGGLISLFIRTSDRMNTENTQTTLDCTQKKQNKKEQCVIIFIHH